MKLASKSVVKIFRTWRLEAGLNYTLAVGPVKFLLFGRSTIRLLKLIYVLLQIIHI